MSTRPTQVSDESLIKATGKPWAYWQEVFSHMDAKSLPHKEIATKLYEEHNVPSWWCQMLTVRFEQEIGRRQAGQRTDGDYDISVSKTIPGSMDDALVSWQEGIGKQSEFNGVDINAPAETSESSKWRYWRIKLQDGSRVLINFSDKGEGKTLFQLQHEKIADEKAAGKWRAYWKNIL